MYQNLVVRHNISILKHDYMKCLLFLLSDSRKLLRTTSSPDSAQEQNEPKQNKPHRHQSLEPLMTDLIFKV